MPTYIVYYSQGNTPGPFDIYLSGSSGLSLYASNIAQWQLVNGYQVTFPDGIPSSSVDIFDTSYGCFVDQNVPFPTPSPTVTPTISITPSVTPTISFTPTVTPTRTVTPTVTPSFTPPPTRTPTISLTPTVSPTPFISRTPTRTPTVTRTPSATTPPNYVAYGATTGYSQAYQACYQFNTGGFNGGWVYFIDPPGGVLGAVAYSSPGVLLIGGNLWYAIGSYYILPGFATAFQIDNSGVVVDIQYNLCILV
jgi:hypothetical protein